MNQAFMTQITNMLASAQSAATSAGLAIKAEVPELCRQIVTWELWSNATHGLICLLAAIVTVSVAASALKWLASVKPKVERCSEEAAARENREIVACIVLFAAGLLIIPELIGVWSSLSKVIKCLAAPDLVILDYVKAAIAAVK